MQGVILAAGKGSRLHPITLKRSKAMLPIAGKPMVERVMETLRVNGVHEFVMLVSGDDSEIRRYFSAEALTDVDIQFVVQPQRLGMANALQLAGPYLRGPFVLSACDNLTPPGHVAALLAQHGSRQADATLSLMEVDPALVSSTGIVEWDGDRVLRIVEKPTPAEAPSNISSLPLYVFSPRILGYLPEVKPSRRGEYELQDAIQMLIERDGQVTGVFTGNRLQLTNAADLLALNLHYLSIGSEPPHLAPLSIGPHTRLVTPLRIEEGTTIGPDCVIGPRVYIERDCRIGDGAYIEDAVILRGSVVEDGRQVVGEVVS